MVYQNFIESRNTNFRKLVLAVMFFSFLAGHINAVLLFSTSMTVSHVSGNISHLGEFAVSGISEYIEMIGLILVSFFTGAVISGYVLMDSHYASFRKYGVLSIVEGLLLLIVALFGKNHLLIAVSASSLGMGVQNSMVSSYKGMIIRTTHMTGVLTDFGFMVGSYLKARHISQGKLFFLAFNLVSFFLGALSGYWCVPRFHFHSIYFFSIGCIVLGFLFNIYRNHDSEH